MQCDRVDLSRNNVAILKIVVSPDIPGPFYRIKDSRLLVGLSTVVSDEIVEIRLGFLFGQFYHRISDYHRAILP